MVSKTSGVSFLLIVAACCIHLYWSPKAGKIVRTKAGDVKGIVSTSRDGRDFYEWLGIPYAEPPVGSLRYASPKPVEPWEGVKDGSRYGSKCAQLDLLTRILMGNEDCLYLNVHVPKVDIQKGLPVMVYIHGGGFNGMGADDYGPKYFMDEDVALVVINYRLGSFGFLSTGDASIRGNMGLKDQALALKWVKENIEYFGGDPKRITIFGESAGGASIHYLMLSPLTRGLFSKAISQSGVATEPWGFHSTQVAVKHTADFASSVGCNFTQSTIMVQCLRERSTRELLEAAMRDMETHNVPKPHLDGYLFRPTLETVKDDYAFLTEHPLDVVSSGKAHRVPWMLGVTSHEGLISSMEFHKNPEAMAAFEKKWEKSIGSTFGIPRSNPRITEIAEKIRQFYFPDSRVMTNQDKLDRYTELFSDAFFNLHLSHTAAVQRQFSPVYLFYYSRRGGPSLTMVTAEIHERFPILLEFVLLVVKHYYNYYVRGVKPTDYGVCHADELVMQFNMPWVYNIPKKEDDPDYEFSKDFVKLWADFASDEHSLQFRGQRFQRTAQNGTLTYLDLSEKPKIIEEPFVDRLNFLKPLNFLRRS